MDTPDSKRVTSPLPKAHLTNYTQALVHTLIHHVNNQCINVISYNYPPTVVHLDAELIQAKVPILKFRDSRNGLQVDLNCNNVVGIRNTNLLHCYSRCTYQYTYIITLFVIALIYIAEPFLLLKAIDSVSIV